MSDDDLRKAVEEVVLKLPDLLRADLSSREPTVRKGAEETVSARIIMALEAIRESQ